jgi:hypothetical protein
VVAGKGRTPIGENADQFAARERPADLLLGQAGETNAGERLGEQLDKDMIAVRIGPGTTRGRSLAAR